MKKTILVDMDGVLNEYNGKFDELYIPQIRNGAKNFLKELSKKFIIKIFTSRNCDFTSKWVEDNNLSDLVTGVTNQKEPAFLIIDDRCIQFNGNYNDMLDEIKNFKVWYK